MIEDKDLPDYIRREVAAYRARERRDRMLLMLGYTVMFGVVGAIGASIRVSLAGGAA